MLPILSADQIREVERLTMERSAISELELMERAGKVAADRILQLIFSVDAAVLVLCGMGNNGGDGLVIARYLSQAGSNVRVVRLKHSSKPSASNAVNADRLQAIGIAIEEVEQGDHLHIHRNEVIIDAILGIGSERPLEGMLAHIVDQVNNSHRPVIAIDLPTGLSTDDRSSTDRIKINAAVTITFEVPKLSLLLPQNALSAGRVEIVPIGFDRNAIDAQRTDHYLIERSDVIDLLPQRPINGHKGTFGHALLIAGSVGKSGAAVLATRAALRSGTGLVSVLVPEASIPILQSTVPEAMCLADGSELPQFDPYTAIGIGPGLGITDLSKRLVKHLIQNGSNLVIDADALNILSEERTWIAFLPPGSILTPHPKEFDRLNGSAPANDHDRLQKAREFARKSRCILVLKGHRTAICDASGKVFFNPTGNPGMAKGGSGDALTGLLTGLLAQRLSPLHASILGVYLHGLAGDIASEKIGMDGMIVSDLIGAIPEAWEQLRNGSEKIVN